jgi:glycosyltransferase 2 family protein
MKLAPPRRNWRPLLVALRLLVSGGLLAFLVWQANPAQIWAQWRKASLGLLLLACLLQVAGIAISAFKWGVLLRANQRPQPYPWLLATYFVGQFANNFLPTSVGGDAMRVVLLGRRGGSYAQASASVFMERLSGFLALSLIALGALLVTSTDLFGARLVTEPALTVTAAGFALLALAAVALALAAPWLLSRFEHLLPAVVRRPLAQVAEALGQYGHRRGTLAAALGLSALFHSVWISLHLVCALALSIAAPPVIYALMVPLSDILGLAPIFFNNVGARDLIFTIYLGQVGVPTATALALAFTVFTVRLTVSAIGGLVLLFGGASLRSSGAEADVAAR